MLAKNITIPASAHLGVIAIVVRACMMTGAALPLPFPERHGSLAFPLSSPANHPARSRRVRAQHIFHVFGKRTGTDFLTVRRTISRGAGTAYRMNGRFDARKGGNFAVRIDGKLHANAHAHAAKSRLQQRCLSTNPFRPIDDEYQYVRSSSLGFLPALAFQQRHSPLERSCLPISPPAPARWTI